MIDNWYSANCEGNIVVNINETELNVKRVSNTYVPATAPTLLENAFH